MTNRAREQVDILVVDDEPFVLSAIRRALRKTHWTIHTAESGEAGLSILEKEPVKVVIADHCMPEMDGVSFLSTVRKRWPDVQRVMLTGQATVDVIERAINDSEVFRFLNKPWNDSQLVATIRTCLEQLDLAECNRNYEVELAQRNEELILANRDLEKKVEQRTQALIQAEKMAALGRMAGGVAHEVNNPLGGILAFVQVLLRDKGSYDQKTVEALETIEACAQRCKRVVGDLLSFSRNSLGEEKVEVDLNQVARSAWALARLHPKAKSIDVHLELSEPLPWVRGRTGQLEQVLINLLQNAFQASATGQPVVLRTRRENRVVVAEVEDQGEGIKESILARIFEPFFTTKPVGEGTGLGLFICYGIVKEHGGKISVESQVGKGSRFRLHFPAATP